MKIQKKKIGFISLFMVLPFTALFVIYLYDYNPSLFTGGPDYFYWARNLIGYGSRALSLCISFLILAIFSLILGIVLIVKDNKELDGLYDILDDSAE